MKIGLYGLNLGACAAPETARRVARAAEEAGFDSLWTAEHVVLPDPQAPPSPAPPELPFLDPLVALGHLAGHTERVLLATGIVILPQRNPLVLAKELATLDVLSGGRLVFGLGAGYLRQEFEALGIPFAERGGRTDEAMDVLVSLWTEEKPAYRGRFFQYDAINAMPRPVQRPHPPFVVGGQSPPALRRAVRRARGWYGFALDPDATGRCLEDLREAAAGVERPSDLPPLEISVTPPGPVDADLARRYEDLGVDRLVLLAPFGAEAGFLETVERAARSLHPGAA